MASFHYEWWDVDVLETAGRMTLEVKAKTKEGAVKQIEKWVTYTRSEENAKKPWYKRANEIICVYWETLTLDRVGHQR